jgi:hypothetical protein
MAVEVRGSGRKANNVPESWVIVDYRAPCFRGERKDREEKIIESKRKRASQPFELTPTDL